MQGHGWCGKGKQCKRSHDIDLILDLDGLVQTKKRRKRKRRRQNKEVNEDDEVDNTGEESIQEEVTQESNDQSECSFQNLNLSKDVLKKPAEIVRSGSHRAGFDAFMTGFILSTYIAQYGTYKGSFLFSDLGIDHMKNSVYLTGKDHPLNVIKSSFAKVSKDHKEKFSKLKVGRPINS